MRRVKVRLLIGRTMVGHKDIGILGHFGQALSGHAVLDRIDNPAMHQR